MRAVAPTTWIDEPDLAELGTRFRGQILRPADPGHDEHRRIWNGSIDRHPAVILRCADVDDVREAVGFARRTGLALAVRGGGHSFPGHSTCDGVVIDLSPMRGISVDPERRTARAAGGVLLGELDEATQPHGLAVPSGIVTHTGLAGLTLGGGIGWLMRKYGLTIDQLLSVELVTAGGERVRASETENADLYWGVRGGGGNFGVVTDFEFRLNPVGPTVMAGPIVWPISDSGDLLRFYRDWITGVPDELMTMVVHRWIPPLDVIPAELHGRKSVFVIACYAGPVEDAERVLAPLKAFRTPLLDMCVPKPYLNHQAMFDPSYPHGRWYYTRSHDVAELTDEVIDIAVARGEAISGPYSSYPIFHLGGAVARVPEDATAYGGRGAGHIVNFVGSTEGPEGFDEQRDWVRASSEALAPHGVGVYANFLNDEGPERIRSMYDDAKFARLQALKREYDPDNLFRLNQNIPPT